MTDSSFDAVPQVDEQLQLIVQSHLNHLTLIAVPNRHAHSLNNFQKLFFS